MKEIKINKTFVINLDEATKRWNALKHIPQLERFSAINPKKDPDIYKKYGFKRDFSKSGHAKYWKNHTDGVTGVWLSQFLIWEQITTLKPGWYLILEDDVMPIDVAQLLNRRVVINCKNETELVRLGYHQFYGAEAYLVTNNAAEKLIHFTKKKMKNPVDIYMRNILKKGLIKFQYIPVIRTGALKEPSFIRTKK